MASSHSKRNSVRVPNLKFAALALNPVRYAALFGASPRNLRASATLPSVRHWTVGYRHRHVAYNATRERPEPPPVPFLPLQGRWLHQAGFAIGTRVRILVTPGRLVLEVDDVASEHRIPRAAQWCD